MIDFEVQRFTRVCAETGRELNPGDRFFSYLMRDGGETIRKDIAAEAWQGPPEDCLGWWKSEVPDPKSKKLNWAPHDVMLHYFAETEGRSDQADVRYVLALLMIRRRILRLEDTTQAEDGTEKLTLFCSRNETEYTASVVDVATERADEIQTLLSELLVDVGG